jgi:biotin operon repressor
MSREQFERQVEENRIIANLAFGLMTAIQALSDQRLSRRHRAVIAVLLEGANYELDTTVEASNDHIAASIGVSVATATEAIRELRDWGYVIFRRASKASEGRRQYTFSKLTREELSGAIAAWCASHGAANPNSVVGIQDGTNPKHGVGIGANPKDGVGVGDEINPKYGVGIEDTSNPKDGVGVGVNPNSGVGKKPANPKDGVGVGASNKKTGVHILDISSKKKKKVYTPKKRSKLAADWRLPKSWGEWALENYSVNAQQVRDAAEHFRDHWHSKGETKADWFATWRMWCGSPYRKWPRKVAASDVAPDLPLLDQPQDDPYDIKHNPDAYHVDGF